MHWQDLIITIGQILLSVALIPMVLSKDKPALSSSLLTGSVLATYAFVYITIQFWFGALMTTTTGALWFTLAFQKYSKDRKIK